MTKETPIKNGNMGEEFIVCGKCRRAINTGRDMSIRIALTRQRSYAFRAAIRSAITYNKA